MPSRTIAKLKYCNIFVLMSLNSRSRCVCRFRPSVRPLLTMTYEAKTSMCCVCVCGQPAPKSCHDDFSSPKTTQKQSNSCVWEPKWGRTERARSKGGDGKALWQDLKWKRYQPWRHENSSKTPGFCFVSFIISPRNTAWDEWMND